MKTYKGLFRQKVVIPRHTGRLGDIFVAAPLSRWFLVALTLAIASFILLLLIFGQYTRRESVAGQLVPSDGLLNITATSAGTVSQVQVHDGQIVHHGDILIEVSSEQVSAALGDTHALMSNQLDSQLERLQVDLKTYQQISAQQADTLRNKASLWRRHG